MKVTNRASAALRGAWILAVATAWQPAYLPAQTARTDAGRAVATQTAAPQSQLVLTPAGVLPRHILKRFDFDENRFGNYENVPMYWVQRLGPNLPHYNRGEFDRRIGHDGQPSFRLHAITESVAFSYTHNDIPVEPGNRYQVTAWVRTQGLQQDRACLSAAFLSRDLTVLAGTEVFSDPVGPTGEAGQWSRVELPTDESPQTARFLQITVWLAQPQLRNPQVDRLRRPIARQDTGVTAWFDDIEVTHLLPLPSIRMQDDNPVVRPNRAAVLTGPRINPGHFGLACRITISDQDGQVFYTSQTDPSRLGDAPPASIRLADLPSGLYTARLQVLWHDQQITEQQVRFVNLPALVRMAAGPVGICLDEATLKAPELTVACIRGLQTGSVKIPIWTEDTTDVQIAQGRPGAESLLKQILADGLEPVGVLAAPPVSMAGRLPTSRSNIVDLFSAGQQIWQPYLAQSLTHYADVMRLWQIGLDGQDELGADSRYPGAAESAGREITTLIDGAQVAMAWPAIETLADPLSTIQRICLDIPCTIQPEQIPWYVEQYKGSAKAVSITLAALPGTRYSASTRRSDIARRIVFGMASGAESVFVPQPWQVQNAGEQTLLAPTTEYPAIATLSRALAGKHYAGKFTWTGGTVFHIFASGDDATLVAWQEQAPDPGQAAESVTLYLGQDIAAYDLRGRCLPVQGKELQTLSIGQEPVVIVGTDFRQAKLRSLFDVQPRQVAYGLRSHQQTVTLVNPYPEPINGLVRLRGPEGWDIAPSRLPFSLQPGKALQEKVEVRVPYNEPIGPKTLTAELSIDSRRFYQMNIPVTLDLALPGVDTYAFSDTVPGQVIIRHILTNRTTEELNFVGSVLLPSAGRQERLFLHVRPGQTMIKEYIIPRQQLQGQSQLRLSLREINGSRLLNQMVDIY